MLYCRLFPFRLASLASCAILTICSQTGAFGQVTNPPPLAQRILILSIDGMHAVDLARYVRLNPDSAFAYLVNNGVNYTTASCAKPADSFPGMMAIATGGSPAVTGVYYDISYDRTLWPPTVGRANLVAAWRLRRKSR